MVLDQELQTTPELSFPADHYFHHGKYPLEWWYFWGRLENGDFFHYAEFLASLGGGRVQTIHYSLNDKYYDEVITWKEDILSTSGYSFGRFHFQTFKGDKLGLRFSPMCQPVVHKTTKINRLYYSVPSLIGEGCLKGEEIKNAVGWFDHEMNNYFGRGLKQIFWNWVGIKLNNGVSIMAYDSNVEKIADITIKDRTVDSNFILTNKHLYLTDLGIKLKLEPVYEEKIFNPRLGVKYSEQPLIIMNKDGKTIGYGMRERTYKKEN